MRTYFSIVSMGRSGSTLLERLLASHPQITSLGEVVSKDGPYAKIESTPLSKFIDETLFGKSDGVCGFKMPFDHILSYPDVFGAFQELKFKVIFLWRRNKLDQFISMKMAQSTGVWASNLTYGNTNIKIDADELKNFFISSAYADAVLRQMIGRFPNIGVAYEDIVAGLHHRDMLDFLGVDAVPLTTNTVRSRDKARRDVVSNYDEVNAAFRSTAWASFFAE